MKTNLEMNLQSVAPDYELLMVTIRDTFQVESKWLLPAGRLSSGDIETLTLLHVCFSQGTTRRN